MLDGGDSVCCARLNSMLAAVDAGHKYLLRDYTTDLA